MPGLSPMKLRPSLERLPFSRKDSGLRPASWKRRSLPWRGNRFPASPLRREQSPSSGRLPSRRGSHPRRGFAPAYPLTRPTTLQLGGITCPSSKRVLPPMTVARSGPGLSETLFTLLSLMLNRPRPGKQKLSRPTLSNPTQSKGGGRGRLHPWPLLPESTSKSRN